MDKKSRVLVIIPAYNEEKNVGRLIDKIQKVYPDVDIVVIDDGSSDNTAKVAREKGAGVLSHCVNLGAGAATQTGYRYALRYAYEFIVQLDADGQHEPQCINDLITVLKNNLADMVIGSRFLEERSYKPCWIRRRGMSIFGAIVSLVIGQRITDSSSGFRALKREIADFFARINYPSDYQDADVIMLAHFAGFRIREIPVIMYEDLSGGSQLGGHRLVYYGFKTLLSIVVTLLRKKPKRK